ncbi:hypothetical protein OF83DRAFT_1166709 [Amylostereum chailletii]|nr:hypothetical protein OF83DRAFT_1166709 [Amylostereum chailletii]
MSYSRGQYRSSGGYRGGYDSARNYASPTPSYDLPPDRDMMAGLNTTRVIETIQKPSSLLAPGTGAEVKNVEYIGSYNWTDAKETTIIVPGSPPVWNGRRPPFTLSPDSGIQTIDQNGYKSPSSTLAPLFAAVDALKKKVEWPSIDVVTDRNGLRKLMRWIDGNVSKDFRIDLELAGENTKRYREGSEGKSYGLKFEDETTNAAQGCSASTGHYRIIKYDFYGLKMVVRFEVDACLPTSTPPATSSSPAATSDDLSDLLSSMNVAGSSAAQKSKNAATSGTKDSTSPSLNIVNAGSEVPQSAIVELTTRSERWFHTFDWAEALPQLYLSATPHLYVGLHNRGTFSEVRKYELNGQEMGERKRTAAASFLKLARTLEGIQELVVEHGEEGRLSLVCQEGVLKVYSRVSAASCLSDELRKRFVAV